MTWSREIHPLVNRYCWHFSWKFKTPKEVVYMGVTYAKNHFPDRTAQSRTFATNTWTIVPTPVAVAVGRSDGRFISPTRHLGVEFPDIVLPPQRATLPLAGKPRSSH
jgi:hypothetical protein